MIVDQFLEQLPQIPRRLIDCVNRILTALNHGIEFGSPSGGTSNISGTWATGTTPNVADQEFSITHNLSRVPVGFLQFSVDQSATIYKGVTTWTTKLIYLKCHQTNVNYTLFLT